MIILNCQGIKKTYNQNEQAVKSLDLKIEKSELVSLLGPSGCGKSTSLRLIAGFEEPDEGVIYLNRKPITDAGLFVPPENRHIGMVFQDVALFPHLTLLENVAFGLKGKDRIERAKEMLTMVRLTKYQHKMPHQVSGGQQQRAALARALAPRPPIILLDEPFSSLDAKLRVELREEMRHLLKQEGITAILVTHDQQEAFGFSDRIVLMNEGHIIQKATPAEIYHKPASHWAAHFSGTANIFEAKDGEGFFGPVPEEASSFMVRPEHLSLDFCEGDTCNGVVQDWEFQGGQFLVKVKLANQDIALASVDSRMQLKQGQAVHITAKHIHPFFPFEELMN